jgi:hypothetical protein
VISDIRGCLCTGAAKGEFTHQDFGQYDESLGLYAKNETIEWSGSQIFSSRSG